jgi:hypothetical protein
MSKEQEQHDAEINLIIDKIAGCISGHDITNSTIATGTIMARLMFIAKTSPSDSISLIHSVYSQLEESEHSTKH